jgi:predicted ArsR family transcriptional regulator
MPNISQLAMLLPVFQDLIKPQWRAVIESLKFSGGLPVSELARELGSSYMAVKKLGYLERSRVPRTAVGRPEIFYSLSTKADALFPEVGASFMLGLLGDLKMMSSGTMPDKLLFQHFQKIYETWEPTISKVATLREKVAKLAALRGKAGCHVRFQSAEDGSLTLEEVHNPLQRLFEKFPRAMAMEVKMIEQLLETRVVRKEYSGGRNGQPRVLFVLAGSGVPAENQ